MHPPSASAAPSPDLGPPVRLPGRAARAVLAAGAVGALSLVEPRSLRPWQRGAYRLGTAVVSGLLAADAAREEEPLLDPVRDGVVIGAITLALMGPSERLDGVITDGMRRIGISRPRAVMGALGVAGTLVSYTLPTTLPTPSGDDGSWRTDWDPFGPPATIEMPERVRALIGALLETPAPGVDLPGAPALREQLATARIARGDCDLSDTQVVVEDPRRLAVPRTQSWPVTGEFVRDGIRYELVLQIDGGTLSMLSVLVPDDEERLEEALEASSSPGFELPGPEQLVLRIETEQPA